MDAILTHIVATVVASVVVIGAMAYWQGRADERRARRLHGIRCAESLLARKPSREGKTRL